MNKCRYCNESLNKVISVWEVCKCNASQIDYKISYEIQELEKSLSLNKKELSKFRKENKDVKK